MASYSHLLVAVDLGTDTEALLERALALAKTFDARLSLAHAVEYLPADPAGDAMLAPAEGLEPELVKGAEKQLAEFATRAGAENASRHIVIGSIPTELARLAEELDADLLVTGAHEHRGIFFFGGGTERAFLKRVACDILVVRLKEED